MSRERSREIRVGLLLLISLAVAAGAIFVIGEETNLFVRKNAYYSEFLNVSGLESGNPVQLNGVDVGKVDKVILPEDMGEPLIRVWITIDRRYAGRVREDSQAQIKTLGLLGDRYVELYSGSPDFPVIPDGGEIPAAPATSVDQLMASGEDTMENVVAISSSLRSVLDRLERGEGLLGQLTTKTDTGERLTTSLVGTAESLERVTRALEQGEGPLGRLLYDRQLGDRLATSIDSLEGLLRDAREGDGLVPRLISDPETGERFDATLSELQQAAGDLSRFVGEVEGSDGLLQRLLQDEGFAEEVSANLRQLVERLNAVAGKLNEGPGTASQLINDPQVYDAVNDIIVGVDESRLLRWLIRNRQRKGIEKRFEEAAGSEAGPPAEATPAAGGSAAATEPEQP